MFGVYLLFFFRNLAFVTEECWLNEGNKALIRENLEVVIYKKSDKFSNNYN